MDPRNCRLAPHYSTRLGRHLYREKGSALFFSHNLVDSRLNDRTYDLYPRCCRIPGRLEERHVAVRFASYMDVPIYLFFAAKI